MEPACMAAALEAAQLHVAWLSSHVENQDLSALQDLENLARAAKRHHTQQLAFWNSFLVQDSVVRKGQPMISALDTLKYSTLPVETVVSQRPAPPCESSLVRDGELQNYCLEVLMSLIIDLSLTLISSVCIVLQETTGRLPLPSLLRRSIR